MIKNITNKQMLFYSISFIVLLSASIVYFFDLYSPRKEPVNDSNRKVYFASGKTLFRSMAKSIVHQDKDSKNTFSMKDKRIFFCATDPEDHIFCNFVYLPKNRNTTNGKLKITLFFTDLQKKQPIGTLLVQKNQHQNVEIFDIQPKTLVAIDCPCPQDAEKIRIVFLAAKTVGKKIQLPDIVQIDYTEQNSIISPKDFHALHQKKRKASIMRDILYLSAIICLLFICGRYHFYLCKKSSEKMACVWELISGTSLAFIYIWYVYPGTNYFLHGIFYLFFLGLLIYSHYRRREHWCELGFSLNNFVSSIKPLLIFTTSAIVLSGIVWHHYYPIDADFYRKQRFWSQLYKYPLWALLQQYIVIIFFFRRLREIFAPRVLPAIIFTSVLFSIMHIPNPPLMIGCFLGGLFWCWNYHRHENIITIALSHALLGVWLGNVLFVYASVGPLADTYRWAKERTIHYSVESANGIDIAPRTNIPIYKEQKELIIVGAVEGGKKTIDRVIIKIDGKEYSAKHRLPSPVFADYHKRSDFGSSGFCGRIPLDRLTRGNYVVSIKVWLKNDKFPHYLRKRVWIKYLE